MSSLGSKQHHSERCHLPKGTKHVECVEFIDITQKVQEILIVVLACFEDFSKGVSGENPLKL